MRTKCLVFLVVSMMISTLPAWAQAPFDRACLNGFVDQYGAALVAHNQIEALVINVPYGMLPGWSK